MTDNLRGSLMMVLAMLGFAFEDSFLKLAAKLMPLGEVLALMGLIGMALFSALALRKGAAPLPRSILSRTMALRSGSEVVGRVFYALALALTPISQASAILQATPLVVVGGAALLFGEKVSLLRWLLILAGFAGVLIIIRPGVEGFSALSLLAVAGLLGFAGRDLATRAAPPALSNAQLGVAGFLMLALSGLILITLNGGPAAISPLALAYTCGAACFGVAAYAALTSAMRTGEVGVVTPFRYTRLLFALIVGYTLFGERPDALTLIGSAVIVGCGIILLSQGRGR
ncbi:DMT family transporter [Cypionkella sp.]|jgi:drug/metabolite transporter (DMT)-like permease|uniref:DMT family transporter n=1 Tax=Cypionkella sp. TaxID=2811411 RepID=UPI0027755CDA|nr:DMT family transporter [Cypionkella sp.]